MMIITSLVIIANWDKETFSSTQDDLAATSAITCVMKQLVNEKKEPSVKRNSSKNTAKSDSRVSRNADLNVRREAIYNSRTLLESM